MIKLLFLRLYLKTVSDKSIARAENVMCNPANKFHEKCNYSDFFSISDSKIIFLFFIFINEVFWNCII